MAMLPFGVVRVTVRVWPAGSGSGCFVGHEPLPVPGAVDPVVPAACDAAALGEPDAVAEPVPPPPGRRIRNAPTSTTRTIAPPTSQGMPGIPDDTDAPPTGAVLREDEPPPFGDRGADFWDWRDEPRRRLPFDASGTVPPGRRGAGHAAASMAAGNSMAPDSRACP